MLPKLLRKTLTFTAAFLDFSFLFQLLFVPMAFLASARPAIAETVPYLDISYDSGNSTFTFVAQPIKSLEYNVTYKPVDHDVEYNFGGTKSANAQGRVEFTQAAESQSGSDVITYEVESGHITVISTLRNNTQQTFSSSFVIENGEIEFFSAPQQPTGYWPQVAVDTSYISPENELVSVTFTSLPAQTGDLRVEEISLTEEQMAELGTSNNTAYEITSSMENGSFTYDLTLPNPTGSEDIQVQYSEDGETFEIADPDELTIQKKDDASVVTLKGLNHFTVFVVTGVDNSGSCVGAAISVSGGDTCFTTLQAAIDSASSGDTISIHEDLTLTSPVNITKPVTLQGNGHTISPTFTGPGAGNINNAPLRISSQSDITINNLIINGVGGTSLHGISVFGSSNITLNDITSKDNDRSGIVVNGSSVTVNNITTSGNGWHGINIDRGSGLPNPGVLTVTGVSKHSDAVHIYIDNTANGSVLDTNNQYTSAHVNVGGTHPNDLLYTLIPPVKNIDTGETFSTINQAVQDSDTVNGHTIEVKGSITVTENTTVNKDLTIRGVSSTIISTSGTTQLFTITANGVTIENFAFVKTENANAQIFIGVQADDVTIQNNTFRGQFVLPTTGATTRAIVTSNGADNLLITGNSFSHLRQPAYLNNGSSGVISNNYVTNTRGWVVEKNTNFTFTGNTWGDNQDDTKRVDIAIIPGSTPESTPNNYTCILPEIIANNNGAVVEDQYPGTCPDTTMPEMALISPTNGSIISGTYRFVVEASDESGITKILFNLNGTQYGSQLVKGDGDTWYVDIDTTTIPDGLHHVVLRVTDGAGNTKYWNNRKDIHSFTIDNTGPVAPTNGQPHNTTLQTNNFWFTWDEVTDSTPVTYEFQSSMNPTQSGGVLTTSLWKSGVLPGPTIHSVGAPDGTWYWQVRAIDAAGNVGPWSEIWNVTLDTQAPDVQITSPGAGETLLDTGIVEVTGTITDNLKLLRYYFTIRDSEGALATGTAPLLVNTSATSASLSYFWDTSLVEEGEYTLMLEARDAADNKDAGSVHAIKVMIERTPVASPSPTPSPTPSPSPSPEPTPEPSPSPEVSPSPEPTPTPEATPSPSPEPSPEPGEVLGTSTSSRGGSSSRSVKAPVCSEATPGAISNLLITTTASGATLSWTKPEGEISHYGLEFVRLDANGNETGRYGVAALGDSNTTSFTIDNLPGGSAYRFELFAVYKCAPGPRAIATSALITAPGAPDFESGEVIITPNTGEAEVLGTSTDEEIIEEAAKHAQNDSNGSSFLGQVLGASTENCQPTSWWWIFLPGLLAGLALIHVLLSGRLRALVAALLLLGTGFGLYETNCAPWLWIGLATVMSLGSILWSLLNTPRRTTKVPFSNLSRATKMKRS